MTSMISLIVVLLAAYAYSAPVVPEYQNATLFMEVENGTLFTGAENATVDFQAASVIIFARGDNSDEANDKRAYESEDKPANDERSFTEEDSLSTENTKRAYESEEKPTNEERSFTEEDSSFTENTKREMGSEEKQTDEERSFTEETERGIEVEFFESSTVADETSTFDDTSISPSHEGKYVKRSLDNQPWLKPESSDRVVKRSVEIVESSTDVEETSTAEDSSVPSTSEVAHMKRGFGEGSALNDEASETFNRRAIGSVESVEAGESSTVIVIKVHPESTTDEQSSTVEYVDTTEQSSSTFDYETTVDPVEESTSASPVPRETTAKILAIIPGTISRTQYVVPPVEQARISQGQNQTIIKEKKPHY